jgi:hypothetical protein
MTRPRFVAYVYPGWHADPYRPGVDEWDLLARFRPYFDGHQPPALPVDGPYDDTDPATALRQIAEASEAGIEAFTYFLYWGSGGFVMDRPMEIARDTAARAGAGFTIAGTWCVRLPHDRFPVVVGDALEPPGEVDLAALPAEDRPIHQLTIRDFEEIVPEWDDSWLDIPPTPPLHRRRPSAGLDSAGPPPARLVTQKPQAPEGIHEN